MNNAFRFAIDASDFTEAPTAPGVYFGLSNDLYHKGPGLSSTGVRRILKSPFHFFAATLPNDRPKVTNAGQFNGTLTHCATLEADQYPKRFRVGPAVNKNTNAWRDYVAEWAAQGVQVIGVDQHEAAQAQASSLHANPSIGPLIAQGVTEVSAYWIDPTTGVLCKCRPDCVTAIDYGLSVMLTDVKTTPDASRDAFARTVLQHGYHYQAAWYIDGFAIASGLEVQDMLFAVVESDYPYASAPYLLPQEAIDYARRRNRYALTRYASCMTAQDWPGYDIEPQVLSLPAWGLRD